MEIEDIAKIDQFLKNQQGSKTLLLVDSLIIVENDPQCINKLKDAAYHLNELEDKSTPEEIKQTWHNLFSKQVRFSVTRAKEKRKLKNEEN